MFAAFDRNLDLATLRYFALESLDYCHRPEEETEVLSAIDYELKKNLQQEGVISIEEIGLFNCERQKIIATKITNDLEKSDRVCHTVRSGYLFNDRLIRPQEAIVYLFCPPENEEVV